jgi:hypothetical protein
VKTVTVGGRPSVAPMQAIGGTKVHPSPISIFEKRIN